VAALREQPALAAVARVGRRRLPAKQLLFGVRKYGFADGAFYDADAAPGDWTRDFAIDTTIKKNGNSSLRVKLTTESGASGSAYRMLAVPATMNAFWVRFFIRSDIDMGGEHNAFTKASTTTAKGDSGAIEFGEDVGIAFNTSDDVRWPTGYGRLTTGGTNPYVLRKTLVLRRKFRMTAQRGFKQLFVNGAQLINATNYPSTTKAIQAFKFGLHTFHGPIATCGTTTLRSPHADRRLQLEASAPPYFANFQTVATASLVKSLLSANR
jgi:hypothetical protein